MSSQMLWELFFATGLPAAYTLYRLLLEEERAAKTA